MYMYMYTLLCNCIPPHTHTLIGGGMVLEAPRRPGPPQCCQACDAARREERRGSAPADREIMSVYAAINVAIYLRT